GMSWDPCLSLIEFTYNNSFHSSIGMAPFELCMGGDVGRRYAGMSPVRMWFLVRRSCKKRQKRSR
ncbi:hypothetical protein A2U01_0064802, partial [Trifolium medium]|nr:hypothetical protein [Trifolium medium]